MTYSERYVGFVDILGFGDIIRSTGNPTANPKQSAELLKVLKSMGRRRRITDAVAGDDFKFQQFSDSIVMSANCSPAGLDHLLNSIENLALQLLRKGLLLRGGVAKGQLYHDGNILFGPAFLKAFELELVAAKYPRIVMANSVYDDVQRYAKLDEYAVIGTRVRVSDDGPAHVDVLNRLLVINQYQPTHEELDNWKSCEYVLEHLLNHAMEDPNKFEKIKWFAVYWNETISQGVPERLTMVKFPYQ